MQVNFTLLDTNCTSYKWWNILLVIFIRYKQLIVYLVKNNSRLLITELDTIFLLLLASLFSNTFLINWLLKFFYENGECASNKSKIKLIVNIFKFSVNLPVCRLYELKIYNQIFIMWKIDYVINFSKLYWDEIIGLVDKFVAFLSNSKCIYSR